MIGHLERQYSIEQVSEQLVSFVTAERAPPSPYALDIFLASFHVHVHRPEIEALRMRIYNALEDGLATLWVSQLVLELRKLGNCLEVCRRR